MSNETMPEKIWASEELDCADFIIAHRAEEQDAVEYVRKDSIPSRAQVAREFYDHVIDAAAEICEATGDQQEYEGLEQSEVYPTALDIVLREWEEADGK